MHGHTGQHYVFPPTLRQVSVQVQETESASDQPVGATATQEALPTA